MRGYIYSITCNDTNINDEYIGSTINFTRRMKEHKRLSKYKNRKVYNFIRNHGGWKNWTCDIIDIDDYSNIKELQEKELKVIGILNPVLNIRI